MDVGKYCLLHILLSDVLDHCPLLIPVLDKYTINGSSMGLSHDIIDLPLEALVLLLVYNGQNLLFLLFILTILCIIEAAVKVLLLFLAVHPKIVKLFQADFEAQENFLNQKQEAIEDASTPGGSF
jgi:hypothetical protein